MQSKAAATEVTERAKLPWLTLSWADSITGRGFHYVIATSPPSSTIIPAALEPLMALAAKATGKVPSTIACINDDTAVNQSNMAPLRAGGFEKLKLKAGDRLLDIGCGWGSMARYAARRGVHVIGVTLAAEQFDLLCSKDRQ